MGFCKKFLPCQSDPTPQEFYESRFKDFSPLEDARIRKKERKKQMK